MKLFPILGIALYAHAQPQHGNVFFGGAHWGFPLGFAADLGAILPSHSNSCERSDFGNICMGYTLKAELGNNGYGAGLGWAFLWNHGSLGLGADINYLQQKANWGPTLGPWQKVERSQVGADLNISAFKVNLRFGPYWGVDPVHQGDFLMRFALGYGF